MTGDIREHVRDWHDRDEVALLENVEAVAPGIIAIARSTLWLRGTPPPWRGFHLENKTAAGTRSHGCCFSMENPSFAQQR